MCYVCSDSPHYMGCPFYENASLEKCSVCDQGIYKGQRFYDFKSEKIHTGCIEDICISDILDILKITPNTK